MHVLNRAFGGGLDDDAVRRLGSGFCGGMGGGDGTCGALSGAVAISGYLLAMDGPGKGLPGRKIRRAAQAIHDRFRAEYGSIVCNDLTRHCKSGADRRRNCRGVTGAGAEIAVRVLLEYRPALAARLDDGFARGRDGRLAAWWRRLRKIFP